MSNKKDHRLERLIFFSDAVIAIAITLLIIEIHVPHLTPGDNHAALQQLEELLPSFFGFIVSFTVIGRFWLGHSAALGGMSGYDERLFRPNLLLLMAIVIMPFSTALLSSNLGHLVAATVYNITLTLTSLASLAVIWIATDPLSGKSEHSPEERSGLRNRGTIVVIAALTCILLGLFQPAFSQLPMFAIIFADRILNKLQRKRP